MRSIDTNGVDVAAGRERGPTYVLALLVFGASAALFAAGTSQRVFPDETAYVAQTYFWDLFRTGARDDWAWLEYHAYDLPPLPKYIAGAALAASGQRVGTRAGANAWFSNIRAAVVPESAVLAARWPTCLIAALGCVGVFLIGARAAGTGVGLLSASLLALNPLYRVHAARAMSDVPAEAFGILALAVGLRFLALPVTEGPAKRWWTLGGACIAGGIFAGLAVLSKLNGLLSIMVLGAWSVVAAVWWRSGRAAIQSGAFLAGSVVVAGLMFIALNPYTTARPSSLPPSDLLAPIPAGWPITKRLTHMIEHRVLASRNGQRMFPHDALETLGEKLAAVGVQGFGRFGALGPPFHDSLVKLPRYDVALDWGEIPWLALIGIGFAAAGRSVAGAWRMRAFPVGLAIILWWLIGCATVSLFIPLAWDRYFLPVVPASCVLGAWGVWTIGRFAHARLIARPLRG